MRRATFLDSGHSGWEMECPDCGARISSGFFDPVCPVCGSSCTILSAPAPTDSDVAAMLREAETYLEG